MPDFDCNGVWFSWIGFPKNTPIKQLPAPNDGAFEIFREDLTGKFTGIHLVTKAPLAGQCVPDPHHHITFNRVEGITVFTYDGEITPDAATAVLVARGTRQTIFLVGRDFKLQDDDEWIAVKTT
jgi:hypothetical protein